MQTLHALSFSFALLSQATALPSLTTRSSPSIAWSDCPNITAPNLDCGQISVPMDYENPDNNEMVTLAIARLKANSTSRLGSIVYNPGGPGQPASTMIIAVAQGAYLFSPELLSHYDIIGLDPRGTGFSQPVECDPTLWNPRVSFRPKSGADYDKLIAHNNAFAESCKQKTGTLLDHLDTVHVAEDIELVRQALNEGKLNYLGQSYGSQIGETYAELYLENIGRMALDGTADHSLSEMGFLSSAATTLEITLNKFFEWCNTTQDCALHGKNVVGIWDSLIDEAEKDPIPAPGCIETGACQPDVTGEDIIFSVKTALHAFTQNPLFGPGWPALSVAIGQAAEGNATLLSQPLSNSTTDSLFPTIAISCQDWVRTAGSAADLVLREEMATTLAPHAKGYPPVWILQVACIGWPAKVTNPNHVLDQSKTSKAPSILLVHSYWDPATSIEWANNVRLQLPGSVLVIRDGVGHSSYQLGSDSSKAMDDYLINGHMPAQGTVYGS